ncbi:mitochondrial inner membrane protease ATP23 homolog isoform X1 [Hydractinia symbiolongicarpus]|uniref:mitochondrial inner membrane protease ATP23 homolog isoform X1 n=2 Tax=Hydractinia symbiolongicarpus TaxID=13093 RepID=UPI00254D7130|nr:mitochondrial inner membrane protease ATP23 homolog isoform X1 [Hydractinia symbiolongicarpus]XP_057312835.1 mitochondrial inner membrane protease ATP23 homolog isoform X1 [Hydractinia symbiolongicarpus]
MPSYQNQEHINCMKKANVACKFSGPVQFMLSQLKALGCEISLENKRLLCEPCDSKLFGGFDPDAKEVILCENNLSSQEQYNTILTHELVHAYDVCRVKYDTNNLRHLACSEIRAANLSGDCSFWKEKPTSVKAHYQTCVKRKAVESILCMKNISRGKAEQIVDSVFTECFKDTAPFSKIPLLK